MLSLGILGSGNGTSLQLVWQAIADHRLDARIVLAASDHPDSGLLKTAQAHQVPTHHLNCTPWKNKFPHPIQAQAAAAFQEHGADLLLLAGFMRLVGPPLLSTFPRRILNVHPSLLPSYPGLEAWRQALEAGERRTGCTIHLVDEGMDTGPVLLQHPVEIQPTDTPQSLHQRIQLAEQQAYLAVLQQWPKFDV